MLTQTFSVFPISCAVHGSLRSRCARISRRVLPYRKSGGMSNTAKKGCRISRIKCINNPGENLFHAGTWQGLVRALVPLRERMVHCFLFHEIFRAAQFNLAVHFCIIGTGLHNLGKVNAGCFRHGIKYLFHDNGHIA